MLFLFRWKRAGEVPPTEVVIPRSGGAGPRRHFDVFQKEQHHAAQALNAKASASAFTLPPVVSSDASTIASFAIAEAKAFSLDPIAEINLRTASGLLVSGVTTRRNRVGIIRTRPKTTKKGN